MNNNFGYKSKSFHSNDSQIGNAIGVWNAKKHKIEIEKEAYLLKNRINLLDDEDRKLKKKIKEANQKMQEFLLKKHQDYILSVEVLFLFFCLLFIWKKKRLKEFEDNRISEKRCNINQSKISRRNIQAEIALLKKVESMEIKKIRDSSLKKVCLIFSSYFLCKIILKLFFSSPLSSILLWIGLILC